MDKYLPPDAPDIDLRLDDVINKMPIAITDPLRTHYNDPLQSCKCCRFRRVDLQGGPDICIQTKGELQDESHCIDAIKICRGMYGQSLDVIL